MASLKKRGDSYYLQYYLPGRKQRRLNLHTDSFQIAKEKLRRFESAQLEFGDIPLPTRTPVAAILTAYVEHIRNVKTAKSAQTDIYYLREVFGPICDALRVTSRKLSPKTKKRPPKPGQDRRFKSPTIKTSHLESITTADISTFITSQMKSRGLAPKTANRYREILVRLFNWARTQRGVKLPGGVNPAERVERYKELAPEIRFLSLEQIEQQLSALDDSPKLQAMVAVLIFAGLRREELLWLRHDDIDWEAKPFGLIHIRAKTIAGERWQPKTGIARSVPISSQLRPYLDKQRLRAGRSDWFFPAPTGGRYDPDNFSSDLRSANEKKGMTWSEQEAKRSRRANSAAEKKSTTPFGCLDYRHTFGSQLARKGESLYKISKLMGNSPEICRRHYASLNSEDLTDAVEFPSTPSTTTVVACVSS